jgi:hypothetical protein
VSLPLASDLYLTGDLVDCSAEGGQDVVGIQPCPVCATVCTSKVCKGGARAGEACAGGDCPDGFCCTRRCAGDADCPAGAACAGAPTCLGGPNDGLACAAGDSDVPTLCLAGAYAGRPCTTDADCPGSLCNRPYATSHDCPPPSDASKLVGTLPIAFHLTTDPTGTDPAVRMTARPTPQQYVFCGYCSATAAFGLCAGGSNDRHTCLSPGDCPDGSCTGPFACVSDADCADRGPLKTCLQRYSGAFGVGEAATIAATGAPAGDLTDRQPHPATLASVFCVPPALSAPVDASGSLPGPGMVSLPGTVTLLPAP